MHEPVHSMIASSMVYSIQRDCGDGVLSDAVLGASVVAPFSCYNNTFLKVSNLDRCADKN